MAGNGRTEGYQRLEHTLLLHGIRSHEHVHVIGASPVQRERSPADQQELQAGVREIDEQTGYASG